MSAKPLEEIEYSPTKTHKRLRKKHTKNEKNLNVVEGEVVLQDGTPKAKTLLGEVDRRGGATKGSGRPSKISKLSNYNISLKLLDESMPDAIAVLREGMGPENDMVIRIKCAETILKKVIPDKKEQKVIDNPNSKKVMTSEMIEDAVYSVGTLLEQKIDSMEIVNETIIEIKK